MKGNSHQKKETEKDWKEGRKEARPKRRKEGKIQRKKEGRKETLKAEGTLYEEKNDRRKREKKKA